MAEYNYNYRETVIEDIRRYLHDEYEGEINADKFDTIYDDLWIEDTVTGNGSGSYTFNTLEAQKNLLGNWDLIEEAAEAFGTEPTVSTGYEHGPEWWDVTIRCYLLTECLEQVLMEEMEGKEK